MLKVNIIIMYVLIYCIVKTPTIILTEIESIKK